MTKKDKYAIQFLYAAGNTSEYIAKDLSLDIKQVTKFLGTIVKKNNENIPDIPQKEDKTKNLMIRHTSDKKNNTVSIMTQGASQIGDEFYKQINASTDKSKENHIFRRK